MKKNRMVLLGMAAAALTFAVLVAGCSKKEESGASAGSAAGTADAAKAVASALKSLPKDAIIASKAEDFRYDLTADGSGVVIKGINVENPVAVLVPEEIEGYPVVEIGESFLSMQKTVVTITLPGSVAKLGGLAFLGTSITSFAIPPNVTEIPESCLGSTKLISITIPNGVIKIGMRAFSACTNLKEVVIPESVTEIMSYAFQDCSELTTVSLPSHSLTYTDNWGILNQFTNCPKLSLATRKAITDSGYKGSF